MQHNQRSKEYVDPQVQGALWRRLVLHWLAFTSVAAALVVGLEWMSDPFQQVGAVIASAWWTYSPLLLVLACLLPVFIFDSIRLSHRFAGPVFRLRKVMKELAQGTIPARVEFRENDFWREMATDVNRVIEQMEDASVAREPVGVE